MYFNYCSSGRDRKYTCLQRVTANKLTATDPFSFAKKAKYHVTSATAKKWLALYNRECQSLTWLKHDVDDQDKTLVKFYSVALALRFAQNSAFAFTR